jgi:hypothetical protein
MASSSTRNKGGDFGSKVIAPGMVITIAICILPLASLIWCWRVIKFPPQIFGNNEDHFRGHVINPIPDSVENLRVDFDDLIIHPDVTYYFRFTINRGDLEKIISYRSLKADDECSAGSSYAPEWWDISSKDDLEAYQYSETGEIIITLCYDAPMETAYYLFFTY